MGLRIPYVFGQNLRRNLGEEGRAGVTASRVGITS